MADSTTSEAKRRRPLSSPRRILANVGSILATNVVQKASTFFVYLLVARELGTVAFGQLALATTLLFTWHTFALLGMKTYVTRDVALRRSRTSSHMIHANVVAFFSSLVGFAMIVPFTMLLKCDEETAKVIFLVFLGLLPLVLSQLCEGVFQGWERMHLIAVVNVPIGILRVATVYFLLKGGAGIEGVALSLGVIHLLTLLCLWVAFAFSIGLPRKMFLPNRCSRLVRASSAFMAIQASEAVRASMVVAVLSRIAGESAVGIFCAGTQLIVPFALLSRQASFALFPVMCRGYDVSADYLSVVIQRMAYVLMGIVLPAAVGIFMLANEIILLFYDDSAYLMSAQVLRITIWKLLFSSLTGIIGQAFWASRRELLALRISVVNTIVQAALCVSLIHAFGIIGAAYSLLATSAFNFLQHLVPATKLFSAARVSIGMWRPIVASLLMAFAVQTFSGLSLPQTIAMGASVYAIAFVGLLATSAGGISQFRYVYDRMFTA